MLFYKNILLIYTYIYNDLADFRFGIDDEGNYGYYKVGADTVTPFSEEVVIADTELLYESLQYSGLVTEDMTFEEMCDVLAMVYPEFFDLLYGGKTNYNFSSTGNYVTRSFEVDSNGYFLFNLKAPDWGGNWLNAYITRKDTINLTRYSSLKIEGTKSGSGNIICYIEILDSSNQNVLTHEQISSGTFSQEIDISSINTDCTIRFYGTTGTANAYFNLTVKKAHLVV